MAGRAPVVLLLMFATLGSFLVLMANYQESSTAPAAASSAVHEKDKVPDKAVKAINTGRLRTSVRSSVKEREKEEEEKEEEKDDFWRWLRKDGFELSRSKQKLTGAEMFVHKAFLDHRDEHGPRIRVFFIGLCGNITKEAISIRVGGETIENDLLDNSAGKCPDSDCKHYTMEIRSKPVSFKDVPDQITVCHFKNCGDFKLYRVPEVYSNVVSMCTKPMYWYNDWPRMILNIEFNRRLGYKKFYMHVHSVSKTVKRVLDYYRRKGIMEIRPYPRIPYTKEVDVNMDIWHVAETLVEHHCPLWSDTKYTSMNDFDDFLYLRNKSLLMWDFLEDYFAKKPETGAIEFGSVSVNTKTPLVPKPYDFEKFLSFEPLKNLIQMDASVCPKSIYRTAYAKKLLAHYVKERFHSKTAVSLDSKDGIYLHFRNSFYTNKTKPLYPDVQILSSEKGAQRLTVEELQAVFREIFDGEIPESRQEETMRAITKCLSERNKGRSCSRPQICMEEAGPTDDWLYAAPTPESRFVAL